VDAALVVVDVDAGAPSGMLLVEGGTFTMGADTKGQEDERPAHAVTLASFWLDRTEVTQRAYAEAVLARSCPPPDSAILERFGGRFKGPDKPVVGVSWFDARAYCKHLDRRLPREAEFERAVRGADGRLYPWGSDPPSPTHAVFSTSWTEDVGSRPAGKGPYGHDDLAGNVWEWMEDDYDPFAYRRPGAPRGEPGTCAEILQAQDRLRREGKQGFTGSNPIPTECEKAIRGGAYNYDAFGLRATNRVHHPGRYKLLMTGFRCAKDAT
jgi:formylglycine-generating enzyme required for sulfatase activity